MMAIGVARPIAHGQAITSTATVAVTAAAQSPGAAQKNHARKVNTARATTIGTNTPDTWSARR
ncbi:hypothetical protein D3C87_2060400 [compost metagenome]